MPPDSWPEIGYCKPCLMAVEPCGYSQSRSVGEFGSDESVGEDRYMREELRNVNLDDGLLVGVEQDLHGDATELPAT